MGLEHACSCCSCFELLFVVGDVLRAGKIGRGSPFDEPATGNDDDGDEGDAAEDDKVEVAQVVFWFDDSCWRCWGSVCDWLTEPA